MKKFKKRIITSLVSSVLLYSHYINADSIQFNQDALAISGNSHVDLSSFEKGAVQEGAYFSNVSVNGKRINFFDKIDFVKREDVIQPCISQSLIDVIGLKEEFIKKIPTWENGQCYDLSNQDENISSRFDDEKQELMLSIPQTYFQYTDENWIPAKQREVGINAFVFDYNVMENYVNYKDSKNSNNLSSFGSVGANIGRWRLRSNYQYQKDFNNSQNDNFDWVQTYLFTDLPDLSAKLFIGKSYTASQLFDSVRFNGVSVYTDDNMLPPILRGYAPSVTGTATSNATVVISQNGRILNQVKVAPGPFSIDDLSSSLSGTLDVKITEEDGSVREYQVSSTSIPYLTRPGMVQYKLNAGRLNPMNYQRVDNDFLSSEFSWGTFNNVSTFGGVFATSDNEYHAYSVGIGANMERFGAVSADITQSKNKINKSNASTGESYRINYAKRFSNTSRLDLTGYQFSNESFMSVSSFINEKENPTNSNYRKKNVFTTSFTQQIPYVDTDVRVSYSRENYWNESRNNNTLNVSANTVINNDYFSNALLSLSLSESSYVQGQRAKQAYLSISLPLGDRERRSRLQYFGSYSDQNHRYRNNVNYYTKVDNNHLSLGVTTQDAFDNTTVNASAYRDTAYGKVQVNGSYGQDYQTLSGALDGSLTITGQGPVLHRRVYDNQARMVIDTDKAKNVSFNRDESTSNRFGLAAISNVPTYYKSAQYVDLNDLPDNINIDDSVVEATLTDGAVGYAKLNTVVGEKALVTIHLSDGMTPPFGALVYDSDSEALLGIVAENGQVYLSGLRPDQTLTVKWNSDKSCQIALKNQDIQKLNQLTCY